ncbi:MAG: peptidase G2 autoproteolytic cleavage domain-containing protein [Leptospirales bacterium]
MQLKDSELIVNDEDGKTEPSLKKTVRKNEKGEVVEDGLEIITPFIAIGKNVKATGQNAMAIGNNNDATGNSSFALGSNTQAGGQSALSMGFDTKATGDFSTAIGHTTEAAGDTSTAMGVATKALAKFSTAMGGNTQAEGTYSTAMGMASKATGTGSTSLGNITIAEGEASVSMGSNTKATGENSASMGKESIASGAQSLAAGEASAATGMDGVALGKATAANGSYSTSIGNATIADGDSSLAAGRGTKAEGQISMAMGNATEAKGYASTALGKNTVAEGQASTAMGVSTSASGDGATSMGYMTKATGNNSLASGLLTEAGGSSATAMGKESKATGNGATSMGAFTEAAGDSSLATGKETKATGNGATSMGITTKAEGLASLSTGTETKASGEASVAMGDETQATGVNSVAMGKATQATGISSLSTGDETIAAGDHAISAGAQTNAQAYGSVALGQYNKREGNPTQWDLNDPLISVGNGNNGYQEPPPEPGDDYQPPPVNVDRNNAMTLSKNGDLSIAGKFTPDGNCYAEYFEAGNDMPTQFTNVEFDGIIAGLTPATDAQPEAVAEAEANQEVMRTNYSADTDNTLYVLADPITVEEKIKIFHILEATGNDQIDTKLETGKSVVLLENGKIRPAQDGEIPFGIISANAGTVGGDYTEWPKKYARDDFGSIITETYQTPVMKPSTIFQQVMKPQMQDPDPDNPKTKKVTTYEYEPFFFDNNEVKHYRRIPITTDVPDTAPRPVFNTFVLYDELKTKEIGQHIIPALVEGTVSVPVVDDNGDPVMVKSTEVITAERKKISGDYNPEQEYSPRSARPEWNAVGLVGKIPLIKGQPVAPTWIKIRDISNEVELWLVK